MWMCRVFSSSGGVRPSRQGSNHWRVFFARHKVPQVTAHGVKAWAGSHTALPLANCLVLAVPQVYSLTPGGAGLRSEREGPGITHHFRFERWLNLSVLQLFPVNSPEESVFPDVSFTLQATAKAFCRMFSHQLLGRKHQTIQFNAGRKVRATFPCLQCSCSSPEDAHC